MGRSRSKSRTPKKHHKSKHRKKSKSKERRSSSHTKHRDKSRERSSRLVFSFHFNPQNAKSIAKTRKMLPFDFRKRSLSITSSSSDDISSIQLPKHRKKHRSRKMDEVERLAEMERQRRQKEAEQKVSASWSLYEIFRYFLVFVFSIWKSDPLSISYSIEIILSKEMIRIGSRIVFDHSFRWKVFASTLLRWEILPVSLSA